MAKLNYNEKLNYDIMLSNCPSTSGIVEEYYIKIVGKKDKLPKNKDMMSELINADWPDSIKKEFKEKYSKAKRYGKPQGGYILKLNNLPKKEEFVNLLKPYCVDKRGKSGFRIFDEEDDEDNKLQFRYELKENKISYYDDYLGEFGNHTTYKYYYYTIDFKNKVLFIKNGLPPEYNTAVKLFKNTFNPNISVSGSINQRVYYPDDINAKMERFVKYLKSIAVFEKLIRNGHNMADENNRAGNIEPYKSTIEDMSNSSELKECFLHLIRGDDYDIDLEYLSNIEIKPKSEDIGGTLKIFKEYLDTSYINPYSIPDDYPPVEITVEGKTEYVNLKKYLLTSSFGEFKNLELEGKEDIFENNTIKLCVKAQASIKGLEGKLEYKSREYKFVIKHGVNFRPDKPDTFKLIPPKKLIFDDDYYMDIKMAYNDLFNIYKHVFLM